MKIIDQSEFYRLYWHDEGQTILVCEARAGWSWTVARDGFNKLNEIAGIRACETNAYVVIYLMMGAQLLPKGGSSLANIRELLSNDPDYEKLSIYVTESNVLRMMLELANRLNGIFKLAHKYRFVSKLDDAFQLIEQHKISSLQD